jgi:SpoVK/Ycf46/Vps4 family AAA+-type ATPase
MECSIFGQSLDIVNQTSEDFKKHIHDISLDKKKEKMNLEWLTFLDGSIRTYRKQEYISELILEEAYPYIDNIESYITDYISSPSPVLILFGPPGTGKTKLIRKIIRDICKFKKSDVINCLFTTSKEVIDDGNIYLDLLFGDRDLLVLEDIDTHMGKRQDGNSSLYNLLSISDGMLPNSMKDKKIILSTNLPNKKNIDEALLRPGRCFDCLNTRALNEEEALVVFNKLQKTPFKKQSGKYTLAEIYNNKPKEDQSRPF